MKTWVLHSEICFVKASGSCFSRLYPSSEGQKVKFQCFLDLQKQKENEQSPPSKRTNHQPKSKIVSYCFNFFCKYIKQASLAEQICIRNVFENVFENWKSKHLNEGQNDDSKLNEGWVGGRVVGRGAGRIPGQIAGRIAG